LKNVLLFICIVFAGCATMEFKTQKGNGVVLNDKPHLYYSRFGDYRNSNVDIPKSARKNYNVNAGDTLNYIGTLSTPNVGYPFYYVVMIKEEPYCLSEDDFVDILRYEKSFLTSPLKLPLDQERVAWSRVIDYLLVFPDIKINVKNDYLIEAYRSTDAGYIRFQINKIIYDDYIAIKVEVFAVTKLDDLFFQKHFQIDHKKSNYIMQDCLYHILHCK
jgi:hypothetical protein